MSTPALRNSELMSPHDTALLVVDMQPKLLDLIPGSARLLWNVRRLLDGAVLLRMAVAGTEQYPQALGAACTEVSSRIAEIQPKRMFSCRECGAIPSAWQKQGIYKILVCGIETHVCIQQTVLDWIAEGFRVYIAADAVGARGELDHAIALRRMESSGATLTTTEAALFEWCETSLAPEFKAISALVRETPPQ